MELESEKKVAYHYGYIEKKRRNRVCGESRGRFLKESRVDGEPTSSRYRRAACPNVRNEGVRVGKIAVLSMR